MTSCARAGAYNGPVPSVRSALTIATPRTGGGGSSRRASEIERSSGPVLLDRGAANERPVGCAAAAGGNQQEVDALGEIRSPRRVGDRQGANAQLRRARGVGARGERVIERAGAQAGEQAPSERGGFVLIGVGDSVREHDKPP